jgi:prefoldin beta subunit
MDLPQETQEKISQLQLFEQKLHGFLSQRQNFQSQLLEIENALSEVSKSEGPMYRITGGIMIKTEKVPIESSLQEREDVLKLRLKNIEKQESSIKEEAEKIQAEVMAEIDSRMKEKKDARTD